MTSKHSAAAAPHHRLVMTALTLALVVAVVVTGLMMTRHHKHTRTATRPTSTSPSFVVNPPSPSSSTGSAAPSIASAIPSLVHSTARHVQAPLQYRVKPGDTLWDIANWFKFNGYQGLYQANWKRLGGDPSLIHPGTVIQISDGAMTVYSCPKALAGVC